MKVITVPNRLRLMALFLTLCVPLIALETAIIARAPWWSLPYRSIQIWSGAFALLVFPLAFWISQGRRWAFRVTQVFAVIWCLATAWVALRTQNFWLGLFLLLLILYWLVALAAISVELKRSFFDPKMEWFQGAPRPIPGLKCELLDQAMNRILRVCRLDESGAFIYVERKEKGERIFPSRSRDRLKMRFRFKEREFACQGVPVRLLEDGRGIGLKFTGLSPDEQKELGDFVEVLRGQGYV